MPSEFCLHHKGLFLNTSNSIHWTVFIGQYNNACANMHPNIALQIVNALIEKHIIRLESITLSLYITFLKLCSGSQQYLYNNLKWNVNFSSLFILLTEWKSSY